MNIVFFGAAAFGVVVGWVTYRTLRRSNETIALSNIATVIGAVGGAAVTGLFNEPVMFAWYAIGLAAGFFIYLLIAVTLLKDVNWLSRDGS